MRHSENNMNTKLNETELTILKTNRLVTKINNNYNRCQTKAFASFGNKFKCYEVALATYNNGKFEWLLYIKEIVGLVELKEAHNKLKELAQQKGLI